MYNDKRRQSIPETENRTQYSQGVLSPSAFPLSLRRSYKNPGTSSSHFLLAEVQHQQASLRVSPLSRVEPNQLLPEFLVFSHLRPRSAEALGRHIPHTKGNEEGDHVLRWAEYGGRIRFDPPSQPSRLVSSRSA